jgi:DNA-binding response OmpR family regulator
VIRLGPLMIDTESYRVTADGRPLDLTFKEFELLRFLASAPGRVSTRPSLLREVWGYDFYGGTRTVDVHVRRLRAKLGPEYEHLIETVRGVGYRSAELDD